MLHSIIYLCRLGVWFGVVGRLGWCGGAITLAAVPGGADLSFIVVVLALSFIVVLIVYYFVNFSEGYNDLFIC